MVGPRASEIALQIGKGCRACNGSGYRGRVGIYEVMEINKDIEELITARAGSTIEGGVRIGVVGGNDVAGVPVSALREASESFFRDWMEA